MRNTAELRNRMMHKMLYHYPATIKQFHKQLVHLDMTKGLLDLQVLHHLLADGLDGSKSQKKLRESLSDGGVCDFRVVLQESQYLFLVQLCLLICFSTELWTSCEIGCHNYD